MERYVPKAKQPRFPSAARMNAVASMATPRNKIAVDAFQLPDFPPRALPPKNQRMANDSILNQNIAWAGSIIGASFSEGLQFLGYAYLSELAQRTEYRVAIETIAGEMTRKWIKFEAVGDDEKTEQIKELNEAFKELEVKDNFRKVGELDGYFGRGHLYLDFGTTDDRDELTTPIGNGKNKFSKAKVGRKRPLKRIKTVEPIWAYPTNYDSIDPLKPDWYNPQQWFVMGKQIHASRLLKFVSRDVPDMLKPAYSFGGLALSQIMKPYVDNWLQTRQSVNDLIHSFVVWGLKTNLAESLSMQGEQLFARVNLFNQLRDNRGCMMVDKDTEEFFNVTAPLGTLDALQAQAQEHMASVTRIPLVKLLGIQPAGLNASSEGEIRVFYDTIAEYQEKLFRQKLETVMHFVMLSLWGEIDESITFSFEPLWSLDEAQQATVRKTDAETGQILVDGGIIEQEEERKRVAEEPGTPYAGLDWTQVPDLKQEEAEGLEPEGGRPDPQAAQGEQQDPDGHEQNEEEQAQVEEKDAGQESEEGQDDNVEPLQQRNSRTKKLGKLIGPAKEAAE